MSKDMFAEKNLILPAPQSMKNPVTFCKRAALYLQQYFAARPAKLA
jgi:hypothetical protein